MEKCEAPEMINEPPHVKGIRIDGWSIRTRKHSILNTRDTVRWERKLGATRLPEMVFGRNSLELVHEPTGICIFFDAFQALREWKRENLAPVEIPAAAKWKFRSKPSKELIMDYDYTYTTPYSGSQCLAVDNKAVKWVECESRIDIAVLQTRDPILFYDEVILYEDELADNGISLLSVKVRVMPSCWFLLLRYWLRVDGVLMRLRDTRIFSSFCSGQVVPLVIRERCEKEETLEELARRGCPINSSVYQDPSVAAEILQTRAHYCEKLVIVK